MQNDQDIYIITPFCPAIGLNTMGADPKKCINSNVIVIPQQSRIFVAFRPAPETSSCKGSGFSSGGSFIGSGFKSQESNPIRPPIGGLPYDTLLNIVKTNCEGVFISKVQVDYDLPNCRVDKLSESPKANAFRIIKTYSIANFDDCVRLMEMGVSRYDLLKRSAGLPEITSRLLQGYIPKATESFFPRKCSDADQLLDLNCAAGDVDAIIQLITKHNAQLNTKNNYYLHGTPAGVSIAIKNGDFKMIEAICKLSQIDASMRADIACIAASKNRTDIFVYLVNTGIDLRSRNFYARSPRKGKNTAKMAEYERTKACVEELIDIYKNYNLYFMSDSYYLESLSVPINTNTSTNNSFFKRMANSFFPETVPNTIVEPVQLPYVTILNTFGFILPPQVTSCNSPRN